MIRIKNVTKHFDDFLALDDLSMHVRRGSIYGLVGPNGAGKSTIIRHITGVFKQESGSIRIDDEPVFENRSVKAKMAYIPDEIFYFTQSNTLDLMKYYKNLYPNFDEELFFKLKECFPEVNMKKNVRNLSKGMQKQVAFWLAICTRPELMILDEPVDGLDPVMRRQIWSLMMSDVSEHGTTILVSSHNLRELEDVCDYVGIMNKGKILLEKSLADIQGSVSKLQIVLPDGKEFPDEIGEGIKILHKSKVGRVNSIILNGEEARVHEAVNALEPIFSEMIPLTLEEIFIYELGGENYNVKEIIL